MAIGKTQGIGILIFGLLMLTGAILVLVTVPSWGNWIADYPAQTSLTVQQNAPAQTAPIAQAVLTYVLGPLIEQIGGYIQTAGYFVGSLLTLIALVISTAGMTVIRKA